METHLAALKKQGVIETWHDRRILAGDDIDKSISPHIEKDEIILLLVSSDFIASDYCYDIEMKGALERHEQGTAKVIPIILRPCDWKKAPFGKLKAIPQDGKPVTKWTDLDEAYLNITESIREAAERFYPTPSDETAVESETPSKTISPSQKTPHPRSSNLRIMKEFSDADKDSFLEEAYNFIARFFENSLQELKSRNPEIDFKFKNIDGNHFSVVIYRDRQAQSSCRIWIGSHSFSDKQILYSNSEQGLDTTYNECLSIEASPQNLFLRPMVSYSIGYDKEQFSFEGAADYLWNKLIQPLQY